VSSPVRRCWMVATVAAPLTFGLVSCRLSTALLGVFCAKYSGKGLIR